MEAGGTMPRKSVHFFFQAEDGIRYYKVTGVQTCALPISRLRGRFVEDPVIGLEDVGHPGGDVEGDLDVGGGSLPGEADCLVEEHHVRSRLDDQGRRAGQLAEYGADWARGRHFPRPIAGCPRVEGLWAE